MKVILFGLTGYGNNALNVLMNTPSVEVVGMFTVRKPVGPFPYYVCEKLHDVAERYGIPLYEGLKLREGQTIQLLRNLAPDVIVVSSFNQIIPQPIISLPQYGVINVHPSLLPKYKGASPTAWSLINDEKETGITIHFIEDEKIDSGRIISQHTLKIEPCDTEGRLRYKLANLSEHVLPEALSLIFSRNRETFSLQNETEATYYPKITIKDAQINIEEPFKKISNRIRAMTPYPGARLFYNNKEYIVNQASLVNDDHYEERSNEKSIILHTLEGRIQFQIKEVV